MLTFSIAGLASLLVALLAVAVLLALRGTRLALLAAAAVLAFLGLLGVGVASDAGRTLRIVLIDASASVADEDREIAVRAADHLDGLDADDELAILVFGDGVVAVAAPGRVGAFDPAVATRPRASPGPNTDLAAALDAAATLIPDRGRAEIVVWTDGRETRGFAAPVVRRLAARGVRIEFRASGTLAASDLRIREMTAPDSARPGDRVTVVVDVEGPPGVEAFVHVRHGDDAIGTRRVRLDPSGRARVAFTDVIGEAERLATYTASLATESGRAPIPANDRRSVGVAIEGRPSFAVLAGADERARVTSAALARTLRDGGLREVFLDDDGRLGAGLREAAPSLLVLVDRPARDVPAAVLEAVRGATGLLVVGGTNAFGPGGYAGTDLDRALPLRSRRDDDTGLAVAVLADVSGSMTVPIGGTPKARAAREAIDALVRSLPPGVRVAIVPFAASVRNATPWLDPEDADERERLARAIDLVESDDERGDTDLLPALRAATRLLAEERGRRHVVLVSDGEVPSSPEALAGIRKVGDDLKRSGATLGVVATGDRTEALAILESIASGPEWFHPVRSAAALGRAFREDLRRASGEGLEVVGPAGVRAAPGALSLDRLPAGDLRLERWLKTWARAGARVVLETDGEEPWPVLARGRHGLGMTAAVPTSPGSPPRWGDRFWSDLARDLARPETPPGVDARLELDGAGRTVLVLEARDADGGFRVLDRPRLHDGRALRRTGAGRWEIAFPVSGPGPRAVRILERQDGRLLILRSLVPPLSPELRAAGPDRAALERLREVAGEPASPSRGTRDVSWIPLLLAAVLVVVEVSLGLIGRR